MPRIHHNATPKTPKSSRNVITKSNHENLIFNTLNIFKKVKVKTKTLTSSIILNRNVKCMGADGAISLHGVKPRPHTFIETITMPSPPASPHVIMKENDLNVSKRKKAKKRNKRKKKSDVIKTIDPTENLLTEIPSVNPTQNVTCVRVPSKCFIDEICTYENARFNQFVHELKRKFNRNDKYYGINILKHLERIHLPFIIKDIIKNRKYDQCMVFNEASSVQNGILSGIHMEIHGHVGYALENRYTKNANNGFADILSMLLAHDIGVLHCKRKIRMKSEQEKNNISPRKLTHETKKYVANEMKKSKCILLKNLTLDAFEWMEEMLLSFIIKRVHDKKRTSRSVQKLFLMEFCTYNEFISKYYLMDFEKENNKNMKIAQAELNINFNKDIKNTNSPRKCNI